MVEIQNREIIKEINAKISWAEGKIVQMENEWEKDKRSLTCPTSMRWEWKIKACDSWVCFYSADKLFFLSFNPMVLSRLPALVLEDNKHKEEEGKRAGEKERCSGVIVCQIHRRIPQSRVASLLGSLSWVCNEFLVSLAPRLGISWSLFLWKDTRVGTLQRRSQA